MLAVVMRLVTSMPYRQPDKEKGSNKCRGNKKKFHSRESNEEK